ncbi:MAG: hypothetical protein ABJC19_04345 [Gemmatimonadota bacterium]
MAVTLPAWFHHAEGVAYDSRTGRRFVGSARQRTIVVIDNVRLERDFVTGQSEPRLYAVFGMAADAEERVFWVRTSAMKEQEGGVVLHDALLYVANSSWSNYTDDGAPAGAFEPQILLKLPVAGLRATTRLNAAARCQ